MKILVSSGETKFPVPSRKTTSFRADFVDEAEVESGDGGVEGLSGAARELSLGVLRRSLTVASILVWWIEEG